MYNRYVSHKEVEAAIIIDRVVGEVTGKQLLVSVPGGTTAVVACNEMAMTEKAIPGDYWVRYADGYRSVSPKKAFEDGYTIMPVITEEKAP